MVKPGTVEPLAYMDGIRAIAVLQVLVFHCWVLSGSPELTFKSPFSGNITHWTFLISAGHTGVLLFFALSGFLLAQNWFSADYNNKPRPSVRKYFRLRFFRIMPAYYSCLFFMLLFFTPKYIPSAYVFSGDGFFALGAHLTFTQYLFPISSGDYTINGSLWTLTIEMIFYLVLPWAIPLFLRNRWIIAVPFAIIANILWLYLCKYSLDPVVAIYQSSVARFSVDSETIRYFLSNQFFGYISFFALGIAVANVYTRYRLNIPSGKIFKIATGKIAGNFYFIIGLALILSLLFELRNDSSLIIQYYAGRILYGIGITLFIMGVLFGSNFWRYIFSITPLRIIGIIGYSVYLWHMPLIYLIKSYPEIEALPVEQRFLQVLLYTSVGVFLLGTIFYLAIEKPFMLSARKNSKQPVVMDAAPVQLSSMPQESHINIVGTYFENNH